jgi:preprotein translocase subunit SecB
MTTDNTAAQGGATQSTEPFFSIEKIYLENASVEIPHAPTIFLERNAPEIQVNLNHENKNVDPGIYQVSLRITVTAQVQGKTMFLVEVQQSALFRLLNIPAEELPLVLAITCPNILFPYARETVSDLVTRAGFPPVLLNPVNFESLHAQRVQAEAQQQTTA